MAAHCRVTRETHSPEETIAAGEEIARSLRAPMLVLLRGDLGAGKTTLVKGIVQGFGAASADEVTSPTFTLVHEYRGRDTLLYHLDLYRIDSERELENIGWDDLRASNAVLLVEWGEKFASLVDSADAEIAIEPIDGGAARRITLTYKSFSD